MRNFVNKKPLLMLVSAIMLIGFMVVVFPLLDNQTSADDTLGNQTLQEIDRTGFLSEDRLIELALAAAQFRGLDAKDVDASNIEIKLYTSLSAWHNQIGVQLGQDAGKFGLYAETPLFIVGMRGDVHADRTFGLPRPGQIRGAIYDNIFLALNAVTGEVISTSSYNPGVRLPYYETETYAGGLPALIATPLPESTAEVVPLPQAPTDSPSAPELRGSS